MSYAKPRGERRPARAAVQALLVWAAALAGGGAVAQEMPAVRTATVAAVAVHPQRRAPATVVSLNEPAVSAEISARIEAIPVRVGDVVDAGTELARLDCRDYVLVRREAAAQLQALAARIELARLQLNRAEQLARSRTLAEETRDQRATELQALDAEHRAARAALERLRLDEQRCRVSSPFRALVTERLAAAGQYAGAGTALVRLLDLDRIEVSAQVPYEDAGPLQAAADISLEFAGSRYPLTLRTVLPAVHTRTRNREVRLLFAGERAPAGAAGKLAWTDPRPHLPPELLVRRGADLGIFVVAGGRARFLALPQAEPGRAVAVDLPDTTGIVVHGHVGLEDGTPLAGVEH